MCDLTLVGEKNEIFFIRVWKSLLNRCVFKNLEGKPKRGSTNGTISASGGLKLLQMVAEPNIGQCASEETEPRRGWTRNGVRTRTLAPKEWIVRSHVD